MAVIEVDLDAPPPQSATAPPAHRYRRAGLALVAALVLATGGAVPAHAVVWRLVGSVPLSSTGSLDLRAGGLFTLDDGRAGGWRVTRESLRPAWAVALPSSRRPGDSRPMVGGRLVPAADAVLAQTPDYTATVLDPATGRVRWRSPGPIEQAIDGVGLSREIEFRPGTEYDQASGDAGEIYMSDDGIPHVEPPVRTDLHGTDLATGRALWTVSAAGSVFTGPAPGAVLMVASDRVSLIDPRTGVVRRERALTGVTAASVVRGLVVVERPTEMTAFDLSTLEPRWRAPAGSPDPSGRVTCDGLVCRPIAGDLEVLDEASGAVRWRAGREVSLLRIGDLVLATDAASQRPLRLLDPATGAPRADLGAWQSVAGSDDDVVLSRWEPGAQRRVFAVVGPRGVRPLGYGDPATQDCRAVAKILACRTTKSVEIYAYR